MNKLEREKDTVEKMIVLYCKKHHHGQVPCIECKKLLDYALLRIDKCKFGTDKPTCQKCTVHCYAKEEKEKIRIVMRYSGPRMIFYHPYAALKHLLR